MYGLFTYTVLNKYEKIYDKYLSQFETLSAEKHEEFPGTVGIDFFLKWNFQIRMCFVHSAFVFEAHFTIPYEKIFCMQMCFFCMQINFW